MRKLTDIAMKVKIEKETYSWDFLQKSFFNLIAEINVQRLLIKETL